MNPRVTLGLLAVFVTLGGYVYFSGSSGSADQPAAKGKTSEQQVEVFTFDDKDSQLLSVQRGDQRITAEKDAEGNWRLQPSGEPADRLRISGILIRLSSLRATRRFAEPGILADYGLLTPQPLVTVRQSDGTEFTLLFGEKAPAEAGTYAKRADDPAVFVVSNALLQDVERLINEPPREQPTPSPAPAPATPTP